MYCFKLDILYLYISYKDQITLFCKIMVRLLLRTEIKPCYLNKCLLL